MTRRIARTDRQVLELVDLSPATANSDDEGDTSLESDAPEPFEAFYRREYPRLVALAQALAGRAQAADIAQEAMLVAYRRWDDIRDYDSPAGWVRGVCSHKAVSVIRRRVLESRAIGRITLRSVESTDAPAQVDDDFWDEVRRLPRRQAQVVALFYALDLSLADVAATLRCAEGTVKAHLFRARATLSERLDADGEDLS